MKTLSIIFYIIGSILLIVSCFTTSISVTWWLGGSLLYFLSADASASLMQIQTLTFITTTIAKDKSAARKEFRNASFFLQLIINKGVTLANVTPFINVNIQV